MVSIDVKGMQTCERMIPNHCNLHQTVVALGGCTPAQNEH